MNKFKKIIIFSIIIFVTSACSYKPVFFKKNYDFKIEEINFSGDKFINSLINQKLKSFGKNNEVYKKIYFININTKKKRETISKDSEGDPSKFQISITTEYEIVQNKKILLKRKIINKNTYNNDSDKFKLEQSEKIIIENLSENIVDVIVSSIINFNDN